MPCNYEKKLSTGVFGLDEVLLGGLTCSRVHMVTGIPGTGKTILGYHFLSAAKDNESSLFISLQQSEKEILRDASELHIDLSRVKILDMSSYAGATSSEELFTMNSTQDTITGQILKVIQDDKPTRIFIDPLTHYRFFSFKILDFRRQVMNMLKMFSNEGCTVLFSSDVSATSFDADLQILSDGIITFQRSEGRRKLIIQKMRGSDFLVGLHSFKIESDGIHVFPRLVPSGNLRKITEGKIESGISEIDELLGGGIERGTITMVSGPAGVGKTTFGLQFMKEASGRGERSVMYTFEEDADIVKEKAELIKIPATAMIGRGTLLIQNVEPLKYSPDEFAFKVRKEVEENNVKIVMIDGISGYKISIEGEDLIKHIHALGKYLQRMGVTVFIVIETSNILNSVQVSELGISYLADNIVFLRYFEADGGLRKAIGVLKKRMSDFEKKMRSFEITQFGIKVGEPLTKFRGIFSGMPNVIENEA